jgi:hypothetical protein
MENAWKACLVLDPAFDHSGADRSLGMLYAECPPPPLGVGNRSKARFHLERAATTAPEYPENRLQWIEYLSRNDEADVARREYGSLQNQLPEARRRLVGERWTSSWKDWDTRIRALGKRLAVPQTPETEPRSP